jgi:hypothetical protein
MASGRSGLNMVFEALLDLVDDDVGEEAGDEGAVVVEVEAEGWRRRSRSGCR